MKIWVISDTHFGHKKLIEYGRPGDFEKKIIKGLKVLRGNDLLIHLGDVCIGNDVIWHRDIIAKLPCRSVLVRGNHDRKTAEWYLAHGWDMVCDSFQMIYRGKNIVFSHCPEMPAYWYNRTRFEGYDLNIHGHLHNNCHRGIVCNEACRLISLELLNYQPIQLDGLLGS